MALTNCLEFRPRVAYHQTPGESKNHCQSLSPGPQVLPLVSEKIRIKIPARATADEVITALSCQRMCARRAKL